MFTLQKENKIWELFKDAGTGFSQHQVLKLSASLCYYTVFSLGPIMMVIIFITNLFFGRQAIEGTIHNQISNLIGDTAAIQIQELIKNAAISSTNFMAVIGFGMLLFVATTVFTEMQESMNTIWNLQVKTGRGWQQMLKNRLLSFSIITGLGFLLLIFLIINGVLEGFMSRIQAMFPHIAIALVYGLNLFLTLMIVTLLFGFIYKVLPDAFIRWKDVAVGALFAAVLFMIGKFGLTFYINHSSLNNSYSPAGSLMILLLWIYYSAIVLYFGAEFTKAYALKYGAEIKPKDYAVTIKIVRLESNEPSVQENEKTENPKVDSKKS